MLAREALVALREFALAADRHDGPDILSCAEALRDARPSMGAVGRIVQHWIDTLPSGESPVAQRAAGHCNTVLALADAALDDTVRIARRRLAATAGAIVTLSASSTVRRALAERAPDDIVVAASEPGGEGRTLAAALGARCIEDREAKRAVADCGAVLVGADAIGQRYFVNKVGTRGLARVAREEDRPFLVVAESFKCVDVDAPVVTESRFETTQNDLVTTFLMDDCFPRTARADA